MAYDSSQHNIVLFGGNGSGYNQTWQWNGQVWSLQSQTAYGRELHAMAFDEQRQRMVAFGGVAGSVMLGDTLEWSSLWTGTARSFGLGCGSPALTLATPANARPRVGAVAQAVLTNIPSTTAYFSIGLGHTSFGSQSLPMALDGVGMPGCWLVQSSDIGQLSIQPPGSATYSLSIPNISALVGVDLYLQGFAAAPGANPAGAIASNGIAWGIGEQ